MTPHQHSRALPEFCILPVGRAIPGVMRLFGRVSLGVAPFGTRELVRPISHRHFTDL